MPNARWTHDGSAPPPPTRRRSAATDEPKEIEVADGSVHRFTLARPWIIALQKEGPEERLESVRLEAEGGGYDERVLREDARDAGRDLHFCFFAGKPGPHRLSVRAGGKEYVVWKGLELPEGVHTDELTEPEEAPDPPPPTSFSMAC
ncbi:MAG: hypothetical protein ABJE95_01760 [Byssovorax sp.]